MPAAPASEAQTVSASARFELSPDRRVGERQEFSGLYSVLGFLVTRCGRIRVTSVPYVRADLCDSARRTARGLVSRRRWAGLSISGTLFA